MTTQLNTSPITVSAVTAAEESAAIAAGYTQGRTTVYYTDCKRLPSMPSAPAGAPAAASASPASGQSSMESLMQLGNFGFLPHPQYAGHSGKSMNKPLYLHHLLS